MEPGGRGMSFGKTRDSYNQCGRHAFECGTKHASVVSSSKAKPIVANLVSRATGGLFR